MAARMIHRLLRTRLQQFIVAQLCATGGGVALSLELYFWVLSSPWLIVLAVVCAAHCVSLAAALFWRGANQRKVTVVCVGNWASALLVTFVAPVMLPVMVLEAMLPVLFAERYVRGRRLKTLSFITAGCALALGALARLQDASGIADLIPDSVVTLVILSTLPIMAALVLLIAWNNGAKLRRTAQTARRGAAALRASQELLAERAAQLAASRARVITAADQERRRIERDLHDGAQQHLVALAVLIQLARTADAERSQTLLIEASTLVETAIAEIRRLAHGIYPPLLVSGGLARALPAAAAHAAVPVQLNLRQLGRYPAPIEAAVYYCCSEALQNAAKHGGPDTTVTITADADDRILTVAISDTGPGFDPATIGTGLTNMTDRLAAIGGKLVIDTAPGRGTDITATVATAALKSGEAERGTLPHCPSEPHPVAR
jgi:signal transduction histidine kinase